MIKKITSGILASLCIGVPLTNDLCSAYTNKTNNQVCEEKENNNKKEKNESSLGEKVLYNFVGIGIGLGLGYYFFGNSSSNNNTVPSEQNDSSNGTNGPSMEQALPNDNETTQKLIDAFKHTYKNIDKSKIDPNKSEIFSLENGMGIGLRDTIINLPKSNNGGNKCEFVVEPGRSFAVTKRLKDAGFINNNDRIAILNFANYYKPGGGVERGCRAQEESLCRISTLYAHLEKLWTPFYSVNQKVRNVEKNSLGGDRGIYTKGVVQLKEDTSLPGDRLIPKGQPKLIVDVLTVAAPDLRRENELKNDPQKVKDMMVNRIKLTVAMAIQNKVDALVLGALGCGAFAVDPEVCADAYYEVLVKEGYASYFKKIVFPILVVKGFENDKNNYEVFAKKFHGLTVK